MQVDVPVVHWEKHDLIEMLESRRIPWELSLLCDFEIEEVLGEPDDILYAIRVLVIGLLGDIQEMTIAVVHVDEPLGINSKDRDILPFIKDNPGRVFNMDILEDFM